MPDHKLPLKKRDIFILLRNMRPKKGHVYGAKYVIEKMNDNVLHLRSVTGAFNGEFLSLHRVKCRPGNNKFQIPGFTRRQFPARTCFAMTTNKSQGQSIQRSTRYRLD